MLPVRLPEEAEEVPADEIFRVLASSRCRTLLSVLDQQGTPIPKTDLPRLVATDEMGGATAVQLEEIGMALHHQHLPMLEAVGLVEITDDDEIEVVPSPSIWADDTFSTYVKTGLLPADEMNNALCALSNGRRRDILDLLHRHREISISELAEHLAEDSRADSGSEEGRADALTELLHVHIPQLKKLEIIESDGQGIRYAGNRLLDDWLFSSSDDSPSGGEGTRDS